MIALRLTIVLILSFSTKALFESITRDWSEYDHEHGQYSMALLSAETTVLRNRVYVLSLEVTHTTKYIDKQIIALFHQAGTDPAKITALETEFTKRGDNVLAQTQRIMEVCVDLTNLVGAINTDIASNTYSQIAVDQTLLKSQYQTFGYVYSTSMENALFSAMLANSKIIATIGSQTGPEIDQINALSQQAEDLLADHSKRCDDAKLVVDQAYAVGDAALAQLVATLPVN